MKCLVFIAAFLLYSVLLVKAQPTMLTGRKWKVGEYSTVFRNDKIVFFSKDSSGNSLEYRSLEYVFSTNGTYLATNSGNNTSTAGTWALNSKGDSAIIDSANFLLVRLDSTSFITRAYSLQLADKLGTIDTAYTYFIFYALPRTAGTLPVTLLSFTGRFTGNTVQLNWTTTTEINNRQFDVEASRNGTLFEKIGTVPGNINSSNTRHYGFDDPGFYATGKNYYRLKQIDLDGNYTLSPVVTVAIDDIKQPAISIYPNPATNRIVLTFKQPSGSQLTLQLSNGVGRYVWSARVPVHTNLLPLDLPRLAKGIYILTIVNNKDEKLITDKLIIQ